MKKSVILFLFLGSAGLISEIMFAADELHQAADFATSMVLCATGTVITLVSDKSPADTILIHSPKDAPQDVRTVSRAENPEEYRKHIAALHHQRRLTRQMAVQLLDPNPEDEDVIHLPITTGELHKPIPRKAR